VLSSGGAKGLAHVGVIQVLEENGIEVDCIAGSSMGAYVGSIWACGLDGGQLEKIARENEKRWNFLRLLQPALFPRQGFLHTGRIIRRLRQSIGDTRFSGLVRPLRVIATHLDTLERVVFSSGDVADAVAASSAIPGIAVPVTLKGERLIDGGIADPLPVDVLHEMGIERIIAVNVIPPPAIMRQWLDSETAQGRVQRRGGSVRRYIADRLNWFAPGNIMHVMFQAISGAQTGVAEASAREADVLLRPISCDGSWHDFTHPGKYIALGRAVAEAQLPALKALAKGGPHETRISRMARRNPIHAS
jgi:NTE family protein